MVKSKILIFLAILIIIIGLVLFILPIPGISLILISGFALLLYNSPKAQSFTRSLRRRLKLVNDLFLWMEEFIAPRSKIIQTILLKTRISPPDPTKDKTN